MKYIDLFAGIGGFRLALDKLGCQCVFSSEWNKFSQQTYQANFGDLPHGDITQIHEETIPSHDILVGGFPCQPFSIAGVAINNSLGRSHGFDHPTQGTLFFDIVRILRHKRPKAFILENVKNLESHNKGETFKLIKKTLTEDLGYQVFYKVIDAKVVVPQSRKRIFIVGFANPIDFEFPVFENLNPKLKDILEPAVPEKYTLSYKLWACLQNHALKHRAKGNGFGFGLADPEGVSRTLSARYYKDGSEILIPQEGQNPRRLTPRECARLMGFSEDFIIPVSDAQAYRQFGNAVVPLIVQKIAKSVLNKLK